MKKISSLVSHICSVLSDRIPGKETDIMRNKYLADKRGSKLLFIYIFVMYSVIYMTKHCYSAAMATLVYEGIMTKSQTGLINALFYLVYAPFQVIGGKLADKHSPGRLIALGVFGSFIANLIVYLNQNYVLMLVTWSVNAVFQSLIWPAVFKITSSNLAVEQREKGVFYMSFTPYIGPFIAYLVAMFVERWQDNFLIATISLFVFSILTYVVYEYAQKRMVEEASSQMKIVGTMPDKYDASLTNRVLFRKSGFYALVVVNFLYGLIYATKTFASVFLMESYASVSPFVGNFFFLFTSVATMLGSFAARSVYFKFINDEIKAHIISLLLTIPCLIVLLFVGKVPVWIALAALMGTAFVVGLQFTTAFVSLRFARFGKNGEVAGVLNCAAAVNLIVVNYGLALLADYFGWLAVLAVSLGSAVLAIGLLLWMLPRWKRFVKEYEL